MSFDMSEKIPQPTFTEDLEAGESDVIEQLKEELRFCYVEISIAVFGLCVTIFHFYLILRDNTTPSFLSTLAKGLYISLPISSHGFHNLGHIALHCTPGSSQIRAFGCVVFPCGGLDVGCVGCQQLWCFCGEVLVPIGASAGGELR
jgi:hypothetical protein